MGCRWAKYLFRRVEYLGIELAGWLAACMHLAYYCRVLFGEDASIPKFYGIYGVRSTA